MGEIRRKSFRWRDVYLELRRENFVICLLPVGKKGEFCLLLTNKCGKSEGQALVKRVAFCCVNISENIFFANSALQIHALVVSLQRIGLFWPEVHCEASALWAHSGEAQPKKDRT